MRLNFKDDNAFFFGMLLLFGSSPIAYLLGGVFKWIGLIFGFGLILFSAVKKCSKTGALQNSIGFLVIAVAYFFLLEFISFFNNHFSTRSLQNIVFTFVSFFLFLCGYLISKAGPSFKEMRSTWIEILFSVIFILASLRYIQYVQSISFFSVERLSDGGASGNPVGIAYQFSVLTVVFLYLLKSQENILHRIVYLIAVLASFSVIITTESRGAVVALFLGMLYLIFASIYKGQFFKQLSAKKKYLKTLAFVSITILILLIFASFFSNNFIFQDKFDALYKRFENLYLMAIGQSDDRSTQNRLDLYLHFLNRPQDWILIGEKNLSYYPHNQFLEIFVRFGLLGIPLFIVSVYGAFKFHICNFEKKILSEEFVFMSMLFAFSYLQSQSSLGLDINRSLFLSLGFMLGYISKKPKLRFNT